MNFVPLLSAFVWIALGCLLKGGRALRKDFFFSSVPHGSTFLYVGVSMKPWDQSNRNCQLKTFNHSSALLLQASGIARHWAPNRFFVALLPCETDSKGGAFWMPKDFVFKHRERHNVSSHTWQSKENGNELRGRRFFCKRQTFTSQAHRSLFLSFLDFVLLRSLHLLKRVNTAGWTGPRVGGLKEAVGSVVGNSVGRCHPCVWQGRVCIISCVFVSAYGTVGTPAIRLLWLFEALAWRTKKRTLGWGQRAVGFCHQVRMRCHHGFPARCFHHLCSMAEGRGEKEKTKKS